MADAGEGSAPGPVRSSNQTAQTGELMAGLVHWRGLQT
jgi:hypothetical protein